MRKASTLFALLLVPILMNPVLGQKITYPRQQIALQLGAIQMGYVPNEGPVVPFGLDLTAPDQRAKALKTWV